MFSGHRRHLNFTPREALEADIRAEESRVARLRDQLAAAERELEVLRARAKLPLTAVERAAL